MTARAPSDYRGDDKLLFGIILGVVAFWLFAQTTLNIAPAMATDLNVATSVMNIAVSITALFSGIFIVVVAITFQRDFASTQACFHFQHIFRFYI